MLFKDLDGVRSKQHHLDLALNKLTNQDRLISELQTSLTTQRDFTEKLLATQNEILTTQNQLLERLKRVENKADPDKHIWRYLNFLKK